MVNTVIVGAQWGDEGKGKITDFLTEDHDAVIRYQGGPNAGHTVVIDDVEYKLHLVPSGILHRHKKCILGNGMVIDPMELEQEMQTLGLWRFHENNFYIADNAHVIMFYHKILDRVSRGCKKIGTTGKGIGPTYADKAWRRGIRMRDLPNRPKLEELVTKNLKHFRKMVKHVYEIGDYALKDLVRKTCPGAYCNKHVICLESVIDGYHKLGQFLEPYSSDVPYLVNKWAKQKQSLLFEGAQGVFLDIDHGTYPFVTSSSPCIGGVNTGTGYSGKPLRRVGVVKAYTTRVGAGPFVTEESGETGKKLREKGHEYGTTTGRPRRCGWLDVVMLKRAHMLNDFTELALTKLDVLDTQDVVKLCTAYKTPDHKEIFEMPNDPEFLESCTPVYEPIFGWKQDISGCRTFNELPLEAQQYVNRIQEIMQIPINIISVGKGRKETIRRYL